MNPKNIERVYKMPLASIYPLYVAKVGKKGRTADEVDEIICWLTGYSPDGLRAELENDTTLADFFANAPQMNPNRDLITGVICGVRVEEITEHPMQEIRQLDKLIDELAKGKSMDVILRKDVL